MHLTREHLDRLRRILARAGGTETLRQLRRIYSFRREEIEAAAALGWVMIETRKPRTGRPSRVVRLSKSSTAKLPPARRRIEKPIRLRHEWFARCSVYRAVKGGIKLFGIAPLTDAYQEVYPAAESREGAYASCSRLLRHPHVFAARQWFFAELNGEIPPLPFPHFEWEIWEQLSAFRSFRAGYRPTATTIFRERAW